MNSENQLIKKAEEVRDREHRLRPSLRFQTQAEIIEFIHGKALVSVLGGNELPSLISAVLGKSWKPSARGFSSWMDWWFLKIEGQRSADVISQIEGRKDILATRAFRRTKTFVSNRLWPIFDIVVKHHQDPTVKRTILSDLELKLLETIEAEGPIRTDRLRKRLKLDARENNARFHRSLTNLESYALVVGVEDPHPEKHLHANIWQTWDRRTGTLAANLSYRGALVKLFERTVDACVLVREDQVGKWFRWSADMLSIKDDLIRDETILRAGNYLISSGVRHLNN